MYADLFAVVLTVDYTYLVLNCFFFFVLMLLNCVYTRGVCERRLKLRLSFEWYR